MATPSIIQYVTRFNEIYNGEPWYGENIVSKLNEVSDELAFTRPMRYVHAIAEVVAHMTYWRQSLISRLNKDESFHASVESEENWRDLLVLRAAGWKKVLSDFEESQKAIVQILSRQPASILTTEYAGGHTFEYLIQGVIDHDIYHLGQIALIRKMVLSQKQEQEQ